MSQSHFSETLDYLYSLLPAYQRQGSKAFTLAIDILRILVKSAIPSIMFEVINSVCNDSDGTYVSGTYRTCSMYTTSAINAVSILHRACARRCAVFFAFCARHPRGIQIASKVPVCAEEDFLLPGDADPATTAESRHGTDGNHPGMGKRDPPPLVFTKRDGGSL